MTTGKSRSTKKSPKRPSKAGKAKKQKSAAKHGWESLTSSYVIGGAIGVASSAVWDGIKTGGKAIVDAIRRPTKPNKNKPNKKRPKKRR